MKTRKTVIAMALAAVFALTFMPLAAVYASDIRVTIDGQAVTFADQTPVIRDNRTLVPVRGVFEAVGFEVEWDYTIQQVTLTSDDYVVIITVGSATFTTNGEHFTLDVPAQIIGNRTMLPIRAVLESVGYYVDWDGATRTVLVTSEPPPAGMPARGTWDGNVYTNEYLGLRFVMPAGWVAATDDAYYLMAMNFLTVASIQVLFDRLEYPFSAMSTDEFIAEYFKLMMGIVEMFEIEIYLVPGTTRIGNYDWYSYEFSGEYFGMTMSSRRFINIHEGFSRTIIITYTDISESLEEILAMFSGLNDPIPGR